MSLKLRIALALALVAGIIGAGATFGSYLSTKREVYRGIDDALVSRGVALLSGPDPDHDHGGFAPGHDHGPGGELTSASCPLPGTLQPAAYAQLVTKSAVMQCLQGSSQLPVDQEELTGLLKRPIGSYRLDTISSADGADRVLSIVVADGTVLQIGRSFNEVHDLLGALRLRLFLLAASGVLLAGLAGWLIARRIVRPVVDLRDAAETIARTQDLTTFVPGTGDGEVGRLARSFTTMVQALATSRDQQQRLIADASHEMRTPLTSLRTNIELLEHFERLSTVDRQDTLDAVQIDVGELTNLLTELVELATDRASSDEPLEPVELAELATEVASRASRRSGRPVSVLRDGPPVPIVARPRMLERAITNLVDNAVKYGASGPIEIAVGERELEVRDTGPGIPSDDLPHVFERFFRSTSTRTAPGSGLGLAIVQQIAERHGGTSWARNRPEGGAAVGFRLGT